VRQILFDSIAGRACLRPRRQALQASAAQLAAYGIGAGLALAYGIALQLLEVTTAIAVGHLALLAEGLRPQDPRRANRRAAVSG
jgi:hypothetical protein